MSGMQSVAVGVFIKVGGRYESEENKGISHYLEHLLFKGSKKYSCRKIKESIEGVGGSLNGFTSEELTCYLAKLPARHLNQGLDILSDMVINPLLSKSDIDKERTVILEELKMYRDLPQSYVQELLDELLWPEQPLGSSIIGTVESVNRINQEWISGFQKDRYTPLNIVVSAAGNLEHDLFSGRVEKIFSHLKSRNLNTFFKAKDDKSRAKINILDKNTEQTHLALGFHGLKRDHPLKHALGLLNVVLGANMSSRLFNEVREKRGLAYEIGTQVKRFQDTGAFLVHAGMDSNKVAESINLILKEVYKIKEYPVTPDEFKRAKEFYLGQLLLALEDTMDHMLWVGESVASLDKIDSLSKIIEEVEAVKKQDILTVAAQIFNSQDLNLAAIGPLKDKESMIRGIVEKK